MEMEKRNFLLNGIAGFGPIFINSVEFNPIEPDAGCKDESSFESMMTEIDEANYKINFLWRKHEPEQSIISIGEITFEG